MDFYGQPGGYSGRFNGGHHVKSRHYEQQKQFAHKQMPQSPVYGFNNVNSAFAYPKDSNPRDPYYHEHGRVISPDMRSPQQGSLLRTSQLPFELKEEGVPDNHSSSLFRSTSPIRMSPMMPSLPLDELSPKRLAAVGLLNKKMMRVPEEVESHGMIEGHSNSFRGDNQMDMRGGMANQQARNPNLLPINENPASYTHFGGGTYFGPTVLNNYGSSNGFFTPQARQIDRRTYAAVPGDASSKSSKLQQGAKQPRNFGKTAGFSMLAENAIRDNYHEGEGHEG